MKCITIGTRASKLALVQTDQVIQSLRQNWPDLEITIEKIQTTGDHRGDIPLTKIGGDGVFVQEIERALVEKRIDLAVHSLKDLPTAQSAGLRVVTIGPREDVRDVLMWNRGIPASLRSENETPLRIGTCSLRRTAQIRGIYPNAQILVLRGNVDTRLRKLDEGHYDAIVLAAAGLHRLGISECLAERITYLSVEEMMPAPGQGALGLEIRDEPAMCELLAPLVDHQVQAASNSERLFMRRLGAGCYLPVAAYGEIKASTLTLMGLVTSLDGQQQVRLQQSIPWLPDTSIELAGQLGVRLAEQALTLGAAEIISAIDIVRALEHQHA